MTEMKKAFLKVEHPVDSINKKAMNLAEAKPFIVANLFYQITGAEAGRETKPMCLWGPPGIGKSYYIGDICEEYGFGLMTSYLSNTLMHQVTGLPMVQVGDKKDNKFVPWSLPDIFDFRNLTVHPTDAEGNKISSEELYKRPLVWLLDDIHLCGPEMQKFLFQLLTQKCVNKNRLPSNICILLAGNRAEDRAGFRQMNAGISSRVTHRPIKSEGTRWIEDFAIPQGLHSYIISFIQFDDSKLMSTPLENVAWANPRGWTGASYQIQEFEKLVGRHCTPEEMYFIVEDNIGSEYANDFYSYTELIAKWDCEGILDGTIQIYDPEEDELGNGESINIKGLQTMEAYAMMTACVGEIQKRLKAQNYKDNAESNKVIDFVRENIIKKMVKYHRAIIPLGIKILILGEQKEMGTSKLIKKLLTDESITKALVDIL